MSDDWDADDFEPPPPVIAKEEPKNSWEDEDKEEESSDVKESQEEGDAAKPKPKPKKKADKKPAEVASEVLADPVAEKLRQQRLVEESDFKATKELFGGKAKEGEKSLDDFIPKTEAEFEEFAEMAAAKMTPYSKSFHYIPMLKAFLRKATASLESKDTKDLGTSISAIANEKLKQEKEATAGKKKTAAKKKQLKVDNPEDDDFRGGFSGGGDDEYDFM